MIRGTDIDLYNTSGDSITVSSKRNLTITADSFVSNGPQFKLNTYRGNAPQEIVGGVDERILYGQTVLEENPFLVKTTADTGSLFTVTADCRLLVTYGLKFGGTFFTYVSVTDSSTLRGAISALDGFPLSTSTILKLASGQSFSVYAYSDAVTGNISSDQASNLNEISIYCLP